MIKTIIFDLGNVIVNVDKTEQFKRLASDSNKSIFQIKRLFDELPIISFRKSFERGELKPKQFYGAIATELSLKMNFDEFKDVWCDIFTLNKDVEILIRKLKKDFRLILLSNTDMLHFEYIKKRYKIIYTFDEWILSYLVGYRKPNPLIFFSALKKAKTLPYNCAYIDDIPEFVCVARLMGIKSFHYKNFQKLLEDLHDTIT